ncbi:T25 [Tupaiid betaherpesvirus 1]|uniref:T25 n=1 Tax=Tupaiid herpesvirus 1 (strain 1) TaxID=10397 RepID=Q91TS4_TUHV1|nr:T25 [Tupaiid betaherpesvirus 1]AAK57063.1 T25 [Tupaiid betaherpesvirus 1]
MAKRVPHMKDFDYVEEPPRSAISALRQARAESTADATEPSPRTRDQRAAKPVKPPRRPPPPNQPPSARPVSHPPAVAAAAAPAALEEDPVYANVETAYARLRFRSRGGSRPRDDETDYENETENEYEYENEASHDERGAAGGVAGPPTGDSDDASELVYSSPFEVLSQDFDAFVDDTRRRESVRYATVGQRPLYSTRLPPSRDATAATHETPVARPRSSSVRHARSTRVGTAKSPGDGKHPAPHVEPVYSDLVSTTVVNPIYDCSVRPFAELNFSPHVLSQSHLNLLIRCLNPLSRQHLARINLCIPMQAHVLDAITEPICSQEYLRCSALIRPIIRLATFANYHYQGQAKLLIMQRKLQVLLRRPSVQQLQTRLEQAARFRLSSPVVVVHKAYQRAGLLSSRQVQKALTAVEQILDKKCGPSSPDTVFQLQKHNLLFPTIRYWSPEATSIYVKNLQLFHLADSDQFDLRLLCTESTPSRETDWLQDVTFVLAFRYMLQDFERCLATLQGYMLAYAEQTLQELYLAYLQCPHLRPEYERVAESLYQQTRQRDCTLLPTLPHFVAFLQQAIDAQMFVSPSYMRFALRQLIPEKPHRHDETHLEEAADALNDPDLIPVNLSQKDLRNMTLQSVIVPKLNGPPNNGVVPVMHAQIDDTKPVFQRLIRLRQTGDDWSPTSPIDPRLLEELLD